MIFRIIVLSILAAASFVGVIYVDEMANHVENLVSKVEISLFSQSLAAPDGEKDAEKKSDTKVEPGENTAASPSSGGEGETNAEVEKKDSYINDLAARKRRLDAREQELKKVEEELQDQKQELAKKMKELEMIRQNISSILQDRVTQDNERIDRLVEFYSNMKPVNAAKVFESLDEDLTTEIIGRMKKQNAGEILNKLSPGKAQKLSEKYAGYISR